jgi:hypothetical protein
LAPCWAFLPSFSNGFKNKGALVEIGDDFPVKVQLFLACLHPCPLLEKPIISAILENGKLQGML